MRVLHVIESLERGGAERVLATLARALRSKLELHVVALVGRGPLEAELRLAGAQVYTLDLENRRQFWRALPLLARLVGRVRPDVLHTHLRFSELYAASIPLPAGTKLVATFHNQGFDAGPLSRTDSAVRRLERHVLKRRFDAFFAVSHQSARSYHRHLDLHDVKVIYNPVDIERVRLFARYRSCSASAALLRSRGRPLIVQVGSFREIKGHDVALAALKRSPEHERFTWVCVGDGPTKPLMQRAVSAAGLDSWVHFAGESSHEDALGWLLEADVVIQPSRSEGLPLVVLEAMALGRPVVASSVGGVPELVRDGVTGVLIAPGNVQELSAGISRLLSDPVAARGLAAAGALEVERHFDAPVIAKQWTDAYGSLTCSARKRDQ